MIEAGGMAVAWRSFTRTDERGCVHYCAAERECIVHSIILGFAWIEWVSDGERTVKQLSEMRAE